MTFLTKLMALFVKAPHASTATPEAPSEQPLAVDVPPADDAPPVDRS